VVFSPPMLEGGFYVKSCVSATLSFIVLRYLLVAFITKLLSASVDEHVAFPF
jgi:hypothetical protein